MLRNDSQETTIKILFEEFLIAKKCINVSPYTSNHIILGGLFLFNFLFSPSSTGGCFHA